MFDPGTEIQDFLTFGEFGGVNPSISDSCTYTFMDPKTMTQTFDGDKEAQGCFLYSRNWAPTTKNLADALARMEDTEAAQVTGSGMSAITSVILQICSQGDEIISSRTIYGGTFALMQNTLPRFGLKTNFVDMTDLKAVESAITPNTKMIYTETISNPLLEFAHIPKLKEIATKHNILLIVDNTFSPLIFSPKRLGADIVIYSLTKFINGASDCVAGAICGSQDFINSLVSPIDGICMLTGPVLDTFRAASILKNMHTLHIRMKQHSYNALKFSEAMEELKLEVHYPGLISHPSHDLIKKYSNEGYGFSGILTLNFGNKEVAQKVVIEMQREKVGYFAVSLGYVKTLFSIPSASTSSEIPDDMQDEMGLKGGLVRVSMGIDNQIELSIERMKKALKTAGVIK